MTRLLLPFASLIALTTACTESPDQPDPADDGDDMVEPEPTDDTADDAADDGDDAPDAVLARIELSAPTTTLDHGEFFAVTARAFDTNNAPMALPALTWTSNDASIIEVTPTGTVFGRNAGVAAVTATSGDIGGSMTFAVRERIATVARVAIAPIDWDTLEVGATAQLTAVAYDENDVALPGRTITWRSAAPTIASVSADGKVTALIEGTTHIVASCEGVGDNLGVAVTDSVETVAFSAGPAMLLSPSQIRQLTVVAYDAAGNVVTGRPATFSGGNPAIATVTSAGLLSAIGNGQTIVTARIGNHYASLSVSVATVANLQLNMTDAILEVTEPLQLRATAYDTNNHQVNFPVTWTSLAPEVATVNANGLVTGVSEGSATITASIGGHTASARIVIANWHHSSLSTVNGAPAPGVLFAYGNVRQDVNQGHLITRPYDGRYELFVLGDYYVNGERVGYRSHGSAGVMTFNAATQTYTFTSDTLPATPSFTGKKIAGGFEITYQPDPQGAPATLVLLDE